MLEDDEEDFDFDVILELFPNPESIVTMMFKESFNRAKGHRVRDYIH